MYTHWLRFGIWALIFCPSFALGQQLGPSTAVAPYVLPTLEGAVTQSLLTANESPSDSSNYRLVGIPDGMGWLPTNDGKVTVLVNHELYPETGAVRAHGAKGAFVSQWLLDPQSRLIESGKDLIQTVHTWDRDSLAYVTVPTAIRRLCSGDLPAGSAFYDPGSGRGTTERIFISGEEFGRTGRAFAHVVTGAEAGHTYELPYVGQSCYENILACPVAQPWTILIGLDDSILGQVYVYIGRKQREGSVIDRAGLTNGKLWVLSINGMRYEERTDVGEGSVRFHLQEIGDASALDGDEIERAGNRLGCMGFLRPEDGHWDPVTGKDFYFVTTDRLDQTKDGVGTKIGRARLYRLSFDDIRNPLLGGRLHRALDGTEPETQMFDNMCINQWGHVLIQEDPGNAQRTGRIWRYDIPSDELVEIARNDTSLFGDIGRPPTEPFAINEETSGIVDASDALGPGWYLGNVQAHTTFPDTAIVEYGQLVAIYDPAAARATLALGDPVPGLADTVNAITVTGLSPGQAVTLHHGTKPGYTSIDPCAALSVQIDKATVSLESIADSTGTALFEGGVPASMAGKTLRLQASSAGSCSISPPLEFTFR